MVNKKIWACLRHGQASQERHGEKPQRTTAHSESKIYAVQKTWRIELGESVNTVKHNQRYLLLSLKIIYLVLKVMTSLKIKAIDIFNSSVRSEWICRPENFRASY